MKLKSEYVIISVLSIAMFIFGISILSVQNGDVISTNAEVISEKISNEKLEWGIKREKNHAQPDLGKKNLELMKQYNAIAMGNSNDKYLYLTFDNGYEAGYTPQILETLKENNVTATFFITAHYLNTQSDLVKNMIDNGNIVRKPITV